MYIPPENLCSPISKKILLYHEFVQILNASNVAEKGPTNISVQPVAEFFSPHFSF